MKICLVTGGAGFIGANLVRRLISLGNKVHILVEKKTDLWRLTNVLQNITVHEVDLAHFENVNTLIKNIKPEQIFHLASFGGMPDQQDQETIFYVNFEGTVNLFNACKEVGFDCFINTGSSSEYGMKNVPMREDLVLEPVSDYGVAKAAATQFCLKEALFNKLPVYTIRPFSIYGDYEMPTRLIPSIFVNVLREQPLLLSSAQCVRDFTYIDDIVDMYIAVAKMLPHNHFVFNAGTGIQSSIQDVVNNIQGMCDKKIIVQWGSQAPRPWEPKMWRADISLAQQVLNWQPRYSLSKGLKKSLTWFKNHLEFYSKGDSSYGTTMQESSSSQPPVSI